MRIDNLHGTNSKLSSCLYSEIVGEGLDPPAKNADGISREGKDPPLQLRNCKWLDKPEIDYVFSAQTNVFNHEYTICKIAKLGIEIFITFVYNVLIAVLKLPVFDSPQLTRT